MPRSIEELVALKEAIDRQRGKGAGGWAALPREYVGGREAVKVKKRTVSGECEPEHVRIVQEAEAKRLRMERNRRRAEASAAEQGREAIAKLLRELSVFEPDFTTPEAIQGLSACSHKN